MRIRPVVLAKDGVPALELERVPNLFSQVDTDYAVAGMRHVLKEPHVWEDAGAYEVADEAAWSRIVARSKEYSQRGEHAVFVVRQIKAFGAIGVANLPPGYGVAVVGGAPSWVVPHELGHSFGLSHTPETRNCALYACRVMSYCHAVIPPCSTVFNDEERRLMRQWAIVFPRRGVVELTGKIKDAGAAKMTAKSERIICKP